MYVSMCYKLKYKLHRLGNFIIKSEYFIEINDQLKIYINK